MTGGSIVGLTGAIVGNMLTPDKALSTLPIAVQQAGVMAATIPAALLMARIGRRPGFWLGTAIGGIGAMIATWAMGQLSQQGFRCPTKGSSSVGAHLPRIPGDIQSSVETEPDIERGPLRRPPKRWTKSVILPRT